MKKDNNQSVESEQPVIDWDLGLKLAGSKRAYAEEILQMLTANLGEDIKKICESHKKNDHKTLREQVHKLHGAVSYCGAVRLKYAIELLENALKQKNNHAIPTLLQHVQQESHLLCDAVQNKHCL